MKKPKMMFKNFIPNHETKFGDGVGNTMCSRIYLLGKKICISPDHEQEINKRIGMRWSAFGSQHNVMHSNLLPSL